MEKFDEEECEDPHVTTSNVCGIVVTFHPAPDAIENLSKLKQQVERVIVVDNGSSPEELAMLRAGQASLGFELIENGENLGIATALNIGVRRADVLKCTWVFLFDQDSCVTDGFTDTMLRAFCRMPENHQIGILIPAYVDKRHGAAIAATRELNSEIESAMTSGSLIRMEVFKKHGLFADELFIDGVDHEYSLRLRQAALSIKECADAVLLHSPGSPTSHRILRKKSFLSSNYGSTRRYYQERNKVWLVRHYWRTFPSFCKRQIKVTVKDILKIVLFEEDKVSKCSFMLRGWRDGLRGRMGRLL